MSARHHSLPVLAAVALTATVLSAQAHDAWVDTQGDAYAVIYGHADKAEAYAPAKVKALVALDAKGTPLAIKRQDSGEAVRATLPQAPSLMTVHFDNGYWSKAGDDQPSKNLPKNEVPGAVSAVHSVKYGKTIFAWSPAATKPQGQRLELVPLSAVAPTAGKSLPVQVLWDGKPLAGAKLVRAEYSKEAPIEAGADGKAQVPVAAGKQTLSVNRKQDLANDPKADSESISANLVFTAQ